MADPAEAAIEELLEKWKPVAGDRFNKAYEEGGPSKHEIEEFRTDLEYETVVVELAVAAFENFSDGHCPIENLTPAQMEQVVKDALNSEAAKYGWYRGRLPKLSAINRCLKELDHIS